MKYASETLVSSEKSQAEIKTTLQKYGATKYAYYEDEDKAGIRCEMQGRQLQFIVTLPNRTADEFIYAGEGTRRKVRDVQAQHKFWEQACRQKWRALALIIKAKMVAVESGIVTFEQEFLSHILLNDGRTVADHALPVIAEVYKTGRIKPLLLLPPSSNQ